MITFSMSKITSLEASQFLPLRLFSFLHTHVFFLTYLTPSSFFNFLSTLFFHIFLFFFSSILLNPSLKRKKLIPAICVYVPEETLVWDLIKGCLLKIILTHKKSKEVTNLQGKINSFFNVSDGFTMTFF